MQNKCQKINFKPYKFILFYSNFSKKEKFYLKQNNMNKITKYYFYIIQNYCLTFKELSKLSSNIKYIYFCHLTFMS